MEACGTLERGKEEQAILLREAKDSVDFFRKKEQKLHAAMSVIKGTAGLAAQGQLLMLGREVGRVQRLGRSMAATYEQLHKLYGVPLPSDAEHVQLNDDTPLGTDEEIPEYVELR